MEQDYTPLSKWEQRVQTAASLLLLGIGMFIIKWVADWLFPFSVWGISQGWWCTVIYVMWISHDELKSERQVLQRPGDPNAGRFMVFDSFPFHPLD